MRRWATNAFLLAVALFAVAELGARLFFAQSVHGRFEYGYHPTAGFDESADGTVRLVSAGGRRFRPQTFSRRRPPDMFRVMVVGDSVPRGASLDGAYPAQLSAELTARGIRAESLNLGVAGYGAHRLQIVLRKALEYQPNLVILHLNDSNEYEDEREFKRAEAFRGWHPRNWPMKSFIVRRLHEAKTEQLFWRWLPLPIRMQQVASDADAEIAASVNPEKIREWGERVRRYTGESVALARARGVPILLLTQARLEGKPGQETLRAGELDRLAASLAGDGVYALSMKDVFDRPDRMTLFADSAHLRPAGHRILAQAIADLVQAKGLASIR